MRLHLRTRLKGTWLISTPKGVLWHIRRNWHNLPVQLSLNALNWLPKTVLKKVANWQFASPPNLYIAHT